MISFQDALDSAEKYGKPSILLANGFSQAWDAQIFNYKSLLERADFGVKSPIIRELFNRFGTYDFEKVMQKLTGAEAILEVYGADWALLERIRSDQEVIKSALIAVISQTHPELPHHIKDEQYDAVRKFLGRFEQIFTLNYDLLFYWARNKRDLDSPDIGTDDGFRGGPWEGPYTQNAHFLHGALHLYDTIGGIRKHAYADRGVSIIDQVKENMEGGRFPLFVSEPTYSKKKARIERNPYLNFCYEKLGSVQGAIFVYGHSLDENDRHIFDKVRGSGVQKVFVSIYGDENSEGNIMAQARAKSYLGEQKVAFFKAETAPVWN